jgi:hypothetical protein
VIVFDEIKHPQQVWVMNIVWPVTAKDRAAGPRFTLSVLSLPPRQ